MLGRMHGISPVVNGPGLGLNINPESRQNNNLIIHLPLTDYNTNQGVPVRFHESKGLVYGTVFNGGNNFVVAKHPTREFYCPKLVGTGAGTSSTGIGVGMRNAGSGSFTYNVNSKNFNNPPRLAVSIWCRLNAFTNFVTAVAGEKTLTYSSPYANWMIRILNTGQVLYDVSDPGGSGVQATSSTGAIVTGVDYLLSFAITGTKLVGYINGVQVGSVSFSGGIASANSSFTLGNNTQQLFASETLNGYLWDFRVYNRNLVDLEHLALYRQPYDLYKQSSRRVRPPAAGAEVNESVTHSCTFTQSLSKTVTSNKSLTHSIVCTQSYGRTLAQSVTQSFVTSHTISSVTGHFTHITVNQSFAVSHSIVKRLARYLSVSHSMAMTDYATSNVGLIVQSFTVTQTIAFTKSIRLAVVQSFSPSDVVFIQSPRTIALNHNFICSQTLSERNATNRQTLSSSFVASQVVDGRNATTRISIVQAFTATQSLIIRDAVISISLTDSMVFTQRVNTQYHKTVVQDINVADTIIKHRHIYRTFHTDTTIVEDFSTTRTINRTFSSSDEVLSNFNRQVIYGRDLQTTSEIISSTHLGIEYSTGPFYLPPISGGPPQFGTPSDPRAGISGIDIISKLVKIESGANTLLLPQPQLANTLGDAAEVIHKRSVTGELASYKKTTGQERFSYTFWLDRLKAFEVRQWVKEYGASLLKITNWRGEIWMGNLITDQPTLHFDSVRVGAAGEKVIITLEFQGDRWYG